MTDLHDLVRAVVENPDEDTPVSMLADHLIESGDGRGEILRRWVSEEGMEHSPPLRRRQDPNHYEDFGKGTGATTDTRMGSFITTSMDGSRHKVPVFHLRVNAGDEGSLVRSVREFNVRVPHPEARHIADSLPNAPEVHAFLDKHFGPDPRQHLTTELNRVLKDSESGDR